MRKRRRPKKVLSSSTKSSLRKSKRKNKRSYSKKYLLMRNQVLLRDRYQCQMCNATGVKLECHHVIRWAKSSVVRQNKRNLISLCKKCHQSIRNKEDRYISIFRSRIARNTERAKKEKLTLEELMAKRREQEALTGDEIAYVYKDDAEIVKTKKTEEYLRVIWRGMKRRVLNEKSKSYHRYGGRGISIFQEWQDSFKKFKKYILENLGDRPEGHSLDRIDNDGNYEPGNIRWADAAVQKQNNSQTKLDEAMVEAIFILHHKFKIKQVDIMRSFNMNNPTAVRNICRGLAWNNITVKYKSIISTDLSKENMEKWEQSHKLKNEDNSGHKRKSG